MSRRTALALAVSAALAVGCAASPQKSTLAELHSIEPDAAEVPVDRRARAGHAGLPPLPRRDARDELTPEAMRRLADLQIEKQFGILGDGQDRRDGGAGARRDHHEHAKARHSRQRPRVGATHRVRAGVRARARPRRPRLAGACRSRSRADPSAALEAIALYDRLLAEYPAYEHNDQVLYQKARAYDELGRTEEAMETMEQPHRHESAFGSLRRGAVPARRVLLHAPEIPRGRIGLRGDHRARSRLLVLRVRALQARLVALQAGFLRRGAASVHGAARLQGFHGLRLRAGARRKTKSGGSRTRSAS